MVIYGNVHTILSCTHTICPPLLPVFISFTAYAGVCMMTFHHIAETPSLGMHSIPDPYPLHRGVKV